MAWIAYGKVHTQLNAQTVKTCQKSAIKFKTIQRACSDLNQKIRIKMNESKIK